MILSRTLARAGFHHGELTRSNTATDEDCVRQGDAAETAAAWGMVRDAGMVPDSIYLHDCMDVDGIL